MQSEMTPKVRCKLLAKIEIPSGRVLKEQQAANAASQVTDSVSVLASVSVSIRVGCHRLLIFIACDIYTAHLMFIHVCVRARVCVGVCVCTSVPLV